MKATKEQINETSVKLTILVDSETLSTAKKDVVTRLAKNVKAAGFREGHVPPSIAEKQLDQNILQSEVIDEAMNRSYQEALAEHKIRPILPPKVELLKFVPYSTLEFAATIEVLGKVKLADWKAIKKTQPKANVDKEEIATVISNLQSQLAEKSEVDRASRSGDEVQIDFNGVDDKNKPVSGASGKDYPLTLGSNTFIPGFEDNVIGLKSGESKTFDLTFPKDYGVAALQNRTVTFTVDVKSVKEVKKPNADDAFAAKAGPFKTIDELKKDIEKQLLVEKERTTYQDFEAEIINEITNKSKVTLPEGLIEEQAQGVMRELQQNMSYRGLTLQEYLSSVGKTEEEHYKEDVLPEAERRLKAGLVLSEISLVEKIDVTPEEIDQRIEILKGQHRNDPQTMAELEKPENHRDIAARLLTEKTIAKVMRSVSKG